MSRLIKSKILKKSSLTPHHNDIVNQRYILCCFKQTQFTSFNQIDANCYKMDFQFQIV